MAALSALNASPSPSISNTYTQCIQSLGIFVQALRDPDCLVCCRGLVHVADIVDEYGRAKIWGDQTKACLPEKARGSLDDTLRHDTDLKSQVQEILLRLVAILEQATSIANRKSNPAFGSDQGSITSVSADSDSGTDGDSDADWGLSTSSRAEEDSLLADVTDVGIEDMDGRPRGDRSDPSRRARICVLVRQMQAQIRSLFDVCSVLSWPRVTDKYLHSVSSGSGPQSEPPDAVPLMVAMNVLDERHIKEKVLQWRRLNKNGPDSSCLNEPGAAETTAQQDSAFDLIRDTAWLCQRLAQANTRRREQLQYWRFHPYEASSETAAVEPVPEPERDDKSQRQGQSQASTIQLGPRSQTTQQTVFTRHSFSTAAFSDVHDTKTVERARTQYALTAVGQDRVHAIPDPPKMGDGVATFPCPYCGMTLDTNEMQKRQAWKRHVFHDLRPYICTFEGCSSGSKLYTSRNDWIYHELLIHRRQFVCNQAGCDNVYKTRCEMDAHLQQEHYTSRPYISSDELAIIANLCDRPVDISKPIRGQQCMLCLEPIEYVNRLQEHLATHMEDIVLFVLPNSSDDGDEIGASDASVQVAAKDKAKGNRNNLGPDTGSFGFSEPRHQLAQDPTAFAKLLLSEEDSFASKYKNWDMNEQDHTGLGPSQLSRQSSTIGFHDQKIDAQVKEAHVDPFSQHDLAEAYSTSGHNKKVVDLLDQLVIVDEEKIVEDHLTRLTSPHELVVAYLANGQSQEAVDLLEHVALIQGRLAEDHPDRLTSQYDLALAYRANGQIQEAVVFLEHVVRIQEKLAEDDPTRLASQNQLAAAYRANGRLQEAVDLLECIVRIREKLAEDHPARLASQHQLAAAYRENGQIQEAVDLLECIVRIREKLAEDHPSRLASQHDLAVVYRAYGQNQKAVDLLEHILRFREKLADDDPVRLASQYELEDAYRANGQIQEAADLAQYKTTHYAVKRELNNDSKTDS